jgi:hypothetical protein
MKTGMSEVAANCLIEEMTTPRRPDNTPFPSRNLQIPDFPPDISTTISL